jgi:hypothetical protein
VVLETPKYQVIASDVEGENEEEKCSEEFSHSRFGVWIYRGNEIQGEMQTE